MPLELWFGDRMLVGKTDDPVHDEGATCGCCLQVMTKIDDCEAHRTVTYPDGLVLPALAFGIGSADEMSMLTPYDAAGALRCHDCQVTVGHMHHPGCDMEFCPRCGGQLISCGCLDGGANHRAVMLRARIQNDEIAYSKSLGGYYGKAPYSRSRLDQEDADLLHLWKRQGKIEHIYGPSGRTFAVVLMDEVGEL